MGTPPGEAGRVSSRPVKRRAEISDCGRYRYLLELAWGLPLLRAKILTVKDRNFVSIELYYTHSVQKTAKNCSECHGNEAMALIKAGGKVPMKTITGVVPLAPDSLDWGLGDDVVVSIVGNATPLDEKQMKKMNMPMKDQ